MRVLVTGAGGQVGTELVRAVRGRRRRGRRRSTATRSTSPTATRCSAAVAVGRPDVVVHAARLDRGRRLRGRPRTGVRASTPSACAHVAEARPAGRRPPRARLDRLRVRRHQADAVRRVGRAEPAVGLRPVEAGGRARGSAAPRRDGRPDVVGVRRARQQHGEDRAAPGRRRRPTLAFVDDQHGLPDVRRRPRPDAAPARPSSGVPGMFHVTNQGAVTWYEFVAARSSRPPATTPTGCGRSPPPSSTRPGPRRRPANSVLDNAALARRRASRPCRTTPKR